MTDNIEMQAKNGKVVIEDGAADALRKSNPELFALIETAIRRDKLTPAKIDKYILFRFALPKGHIVRDMCYLAALSIQRKAKAG